jgi:hypothetical protein
MEYGSRKASPDVSNRAIYIYMSKHIQQIVLMYCALQGVVPDSETVSPHILHSFPLSVGAYNILNYINP